ARARGDGDRVLDERQPRGRASRGRVPAALQHLPAHEADHAGEDPPGARDPVAGGDDRPRDCRARAPGGRADARGPAAGALRRRRMVAPLPRLMLEPLVRNALLEDLGRAGDVTTDAMIPAEARAQGRLVARRPGVVAGLDAAALAFHLLDPAITVEVLQADGSRVAPGDAIARIAGNARAMLTAERVALNFLCHLSGIATATRAIADAIAEFPARVCCTRKTTPGLRALEKYAVRVGGGVNHRFGLDDGILLKDNHIVVAGGIGAAIARARGAV